jgi:polar amino acid transport system substrate-binding protein
MLSWSRGENSLADEKMKTKNHEERIWRMTTMKNKKTGAVKGFAFLLAATLLLFAFGPRYAAYAADTPGKGRVLAGTGGYPNPYTYQETDGTVKGIDIDLLRAVFDGSGYELDVAVTEFSSILGGLDTDRYQIGANAFSKNPAREEKYFFSKPIYRNPLGLIVPLASNIDSFDDLPGKKTSGEPSVSYTVIVESYNKEHPDNPIILNYTEKDMVLQFRDVADGVLDFKLESSIIANRILRDQGLDSELKVIDLPASDAGGNRSSYSHYIFPKNERGKELLAFVNERLATLRANGVLDKLDQEYFNSGAYKPTDEEFNSK